MSAWIVNAIGAAAAICSIASFAPQIVKIVREKDASSVSLKTYALTVTTFALWMAYGVLEKVWPLVVANGFALVMAAAVLGLRWRYGSGR